MYILHSKEHAETNPVLAALRGGATSVTDLPLPVLAAFRAVCERFTSKTFRATVYH